MDELEEAIRFIGREKMKKMFEELNQTFNENLITGKVIIFGTGGEINNFKDFKDLI